MDTKYLLDARATLPNGGFVSGPITTVDDETYLFRNTGSGLDFYVSVQKNKDGWFKFDGQSIPTPQSMINEIGYQIDKFLIENPILNKIDLKK